MPTPVLPTNGATATYALAGFSRPTYVDGSTAPGDKLTGFTGSLSVTFGAQADIRTVGWRVTMPDKTFTISDTQFSTRSSSFSTTSVPTGGCANAGCTTNISGFFAGPTAERAGVGYTINDASRVVGAAAFARQP